MISNLDVETEYLNYNLFFKFIETYGPSGFLGINPNDPLMVELEEMMEKYNQFFFVGDMTNIKILYVSKGCLKMTGINHADLSPYHFFEFIHKCEYERFSAARTAFFKMSQDLFKEQNGESVISITLKLRQPDGEYINVLYQHYMYFHEAAKRVYLLQVHTNIDWIKKIKNGFYYYNGKDLSTFRYPDKTMLNQGIVYSVRELEIISLVGSGLNSDQIGDKLFISPHTVNKHRRNILKKSGVAHVSDLIMCLKEQGII